MNNIDDKVDMIGRIRLSGDMVVYHVLEEVKGKRLFDRRSVSETNEPYVLLGANQFEADDFALLLKKWRNNRFGCENLGNVAITKQDFNTLKHHPQGKWLQQYYKECIRMILVLTHCQEDVRTALRTGLTPM